MSIARNSYIQSSFNNRRILHVDMDAFYVSVELLKRPDLRGKPVIVGGKSPRGVVSTCSYEARKFGIHSAMPSVQAMRLCPDAIWFSGDYSSYSYYSKEVFNIMRRYSPEVYPLSIDEGRVDLTGSQSLFGSAEKIAHRILGDIRDELGLPASGGLANSGTAAKMAAELAKPSGLAIILPGREQHFLSPLPIERIPGVGKKSLPRFHRHGIRTVGDLTNCDPEMLVKTFGRWGYSLLNIANGTPKNVIPHIPVSPSRSNERTFAEDISSPARIKLELRKLVEKLGYRLRRSNLKATTVSVKIRDSHFHTITRSRSLAVATNRDHILFHIVESLVMANLPRSCGIRLLGVAVHNLSSGIEQASLFESKFKQIDSFYKAVDGIKDKYGRHAATFGTPSLNHSTSRQKSRVAS